MRTILEFINKGHIKQKHKYFPKTNQELKDIIKKLIKAEGPKCDLNDIDVSQVTDMSGIFCGSNFNGDISNRDVSNVTNMNGMFAHSQFNGDISNWDVSNVTDMKHIFYGSPLQNNFPKWH